MKLLIGNKAYSSWSFRPWILMRHLGLPFEEEVVALYQPDTAERVRRFSKAGKLPVLVDGDIVIWESLAIIDYLAERFPRPARSGLRSAPPGRMPARPPPKCMRVSRRCAIAAA